MLFEEKLHKLTIRNWGAPWHVLIAMAVYGGLTAGFSAVFISQGYVSGSPQLFIIPGIVTLALGYWNEAKQKKAGKETKKGFFEDILANTAGVLLMGGIIYLLKIAGVFSG